MTTYSTAKAKANLSKLLEEVSDSHHPVQIAGRRRSAVLISEDDWRSIQETLHLLAIPGMRESIVAGMKTPLSKCSRELQW